MKPLPNPITEREVKIELQWSADQRTTEALQRQAALMGCHSPTDYLLQAIAAVLAAMKKTPSSPMMVGLFGGSYAYDRPFTASCRN